MEHLAHGLSGGAAFAALGTYVWHMPLPVLATGLAVAVGAAVVSDLDTEGSCVARSFGGISEGLAWIVHRISGGHREYTHTGAGDVLCAALAAGAIAAEPFYVRWHLRILGRVVPFAVSPGRVILAVYLALLLSTGLKALNLIPRANQAILTDRERQAAIWCGGEYKHLVSMGSSWSI